MEGWNTLLRWKWRAAQVRACEDFTSDRHRRGNGLRGFSRHSEEWIPAFAGMTERAGAKVHGYCRARRVSERTRLHPADAGGGPEPSVTRERIEGKG